MTMTTEDLWRAVATERTTLADLLETLSEDQWEHGSLCADWRVRDVVAHVVLSASAGPGLLLLVSLIRARGNLHRMIRDTAIRHADRTPTAAILGQLRDSIGQRRTAPGTTPADRLMDLLVHGQDIAIPLGIARPVPVAAAHAALDRVWGTGMSGCHKTFGGFRLAATDTEWSTGDGPLIEGPATALLLLLTGRPAAREHLTGDGVTHLLAADRAG
ncbi:maleylpyruvate isomerase family mycothiol-dependent enzyme [Nocardia sp. N2S4-5]|uniref:maleylpyruvate isomerase family mycothiol-dependent enzyme n=1 Tax=Nocardia sp. N2S4-5 TaxID=3351565 RepID=UPI0037CF4D8B